MSEEDIKKRAAEAADALLDSHKITTKDSFIIAVGCIVGTAITMLLDNTKVKKRVRRVEKRLTKIEEDNIYAKHK